MATTRRPWALLLFAVLYAASAWLGRLTVIDGRSLALVSPAAGVAVIWFLVRRAGYLSVDSAVLALLTLAVDLLTGARLPVALLFAVVGVAQAWVVVALLRSWCHNLWTCGGEEQLRTTRDLGRLLLAACAGTFVGVVLATAGMELVSDGLSREASAVWWGRNLCGVVAIGAAGLIIAERVASGRRPGEATLTARPWESVAVFTVTVAIYELTLGSETVPPIFPLLLTTVWAGLRIPTLLVIVHSMLASTLVVLHTVRGSGPFATGFDPETGAMVAQLFVAMVVATGLTLAIGRDERNALTAAIRAAERRAHSEAETLATVISSVSDAILLVDESGQWLVANQAARDALAALVGETGVTAADLFAAPGFTADGVQFAAGERPSARALRGETVPPTDVVIKTPEGREIVLEVGATPAAPGEDGNPRAVLVVRDVTEERARTRELHSFAGVVAHDLRTPLTVIEGWVAIVDEKLAEQEAGEPIDTVAARRMLERVQAATVRMGTLIGNLLAQATASDRALWQEVVDLRVVVLDVALQRGVGDRVVVGTLPPVLADEGLTRQLVENLIGNAVKYVAPGVVPRVEVTAERRGRWVVVSLADNGIGIPEGHRKKIFEQFHRAHAASYAGTGLGLSICKRIVERHGGWIEAVPRPDEQGTVFRFALPAVPGAEGTS